MKPQKNISLIIGLSIPILMVVLVAASIYLPGMFAPAPKVNFLYVSGDDYWQGRAYGVENNQLIIKEVKHPDNYVPKTVHLYIHDVSANVSKEITFESAQKLNLNSNTQSPDGYKMVYGSREDGFFPFFYSSGRDYNAMYLQGHSANRKLALETNADGRNYYYSDRVRFLGWIQ